MQNSKTVRYSFLASLPVMAGYVVLGIGFGVLLQDKGYAWWWATLMGVTIYAGSMQYVAVDLLSGGASMIATLLMTVMVNIRHLFYGITMLEKYNGTGKMKPYLIFSLTDETFSLVCSPEIPEGVDEKKFYFYVSLMNQCYWVIGCTLGAVAGAALSFNSQGIDFAMTALFVVIFVEQWEKTRQHLPAVTGVAVSVVCRLIFGAGNFLIPSMLGITAALFLERPFLKDSAGTSDVKPEDGDTAMVSTASESRKAVMESTVPGDEGAAIESTVSKGCEVAMESTVPGDEGAAIESTVSKGCEAAMKNMVPGDNGAAIESTASESRRAAMGNTMSGGNKDE